MLALKKNVYDANKKKEVENGVARPRLEIAKREKGLLVGVSAEGRDLCANTAAACRGDGDGGVAMSTRVRGTTGARLGGVFLWGEGGGGVGQGKLVSEAFRARRTQITAVGDSWRSLFKRLLLLLLAIYCTGGAYVNSTEYTRVAPITNVSVPKV